MEWKKIYEGWRNKLIPPQHLKQKIEEVAILRTDVCRECEWNSINNKNYKSLRPDEHCTVCGCTVSAKVRCLSCKCPLDKPKWEEIMTYEQEQEIKNEKEIRNSESPSGAVDERSG